MQATLREIGARYNSTRLRFSASTSKLVCSRPLVTREWYLQSCTVGKLKARNYHDVTHSSRFFFSLRWVYITHHDLLHRCRVLIWLSRCSSRLIPLVLATSSSTFERGRDHHGFSLFGATQLLINITSWNSLRVHISGYCSVNFRSWNAHKTRSPTHRLGNWGKLMGKATHLRHSEHSSLQTTMRQVPTSPF